MGQEMENSLFRLEQRIERLEAAVDAVMDDHAELLRRLEGDRAELLRRLRDDLAAMTNRAEEAEEAGERREKGFADMYHRAVKAETELAEARGVGSGRLFCLVDMYHRAVKAETDLAEAMEKVGRLTTSRDALREDK